MMSRDYALSFSLAEQRKLAEDLIFPLKLTFLVFKVQHEALLIA